MVLQSKGICWCVRRLNGTNEYNRRYCEEINEKNNEQQRYKSCKSGRMYDRGLSRSIICQDLLHVERGKMLGFFHRLDIVFKKMVDTIHVLLTHHDHHVDDM